jgi:hypothetical protein
MICTEREKAVDRRMESEKRQGNAIQPESQKGVLMVRTNERDARSSLLCALSDVDETCNCSKEDGRYDNQAKHVRPRCGHVCDLSLG